jgi:hypothetical protein
MQAQGALSTGALAPAGCGQNDTGLPGGLKKSSALVDRDFLVIGLEDYAEMLHLRHARPALRGRRPVSKPSQDRPCEGTVFS